MGEPQEEAQTIGELSRQIIKLDERLFGNGQPGVIEKLDVRVTEQEAFRNRILGAFVLLGGAFSLIEIFLHSGHH
jgi:hypothetical protein